MIVNPFRGSGAQGGNRCRDQDQVHADGKPGFILEYQPVPGLRHEPLVHPVIPVPVRISRGKFHETVAADHYSGKSERLAAVRLGIFDRYPAGREHILIRPCSGGSGIQVPVSRKQVCLPFDSLPVNLPGRTRNRVILRNIALVQKFMEDIFRKHEIVGNDGILPGDFLLVDGRVMVIIPLPYDAIVHRMVHQIESQSMQTLEIIL